MGMDRAGKIEWANSFKDRLSRSQVAIFADYKGLEAVDADLLRKKARDIKGEVQVLKNNIARKAVQDGALGEDAKALMDSIVGPTLVAFAYEDAAAVAKAVHEFSKDHEALELKEGLMGQKRISAAEVEALAELPSREVLLAMVLGTLAAPARDFVSVLAAVPRGLVTVLSAIGKKKSEESGS